MAATWFLVVRLYCRSDFRNGIEAELAVAHSAVSLARARVQEFDLGATWARTEVKLTEPMSPVSAEVLELGYGAEVADAVALGTAELGAAAELDIADVPPPQVLPLFAACGAEDPREARRSNERYCNCIL